MDTPQDINTLIGFVNHQPASPPPSVNLLAKEDEAYLQKLISAIRQGKRAIIIVEGAEPERPDHIKYMISYATRPEAVSLLGRVTETVGRRIAEGAV